MSLHSIAKGDFLDDEDSFQAYIREDLIYFNKVVELLDSGSKIDTDIDYDQPSEREKKIIQVMLVGDGFWLEPYYYWTTNGLKGRYTRIALSLIESKFRSKWMRKAKDFEEISLSLPDYSIPEDLNNEPKAGLSNNKHFEKLMQAFSILNLEWVLYVDSELNQGIDRKEIHSMIDEASNFFNSGEVRDRELLEKQVKQHRFAADWIENFLEVINDNSISLERSMDGIRSYADLIDEDL